MNYELLSEPKATAPKVKRGLQSHGFTVSLPTIKRIGKDLNFRWTNPWYTDVLTPTQKLKRKLFCTQLLRLSDETLLRKLAEWMWTDETWWDLVGLGPACCEYVKVETVTEAKMEVQVHIFVCCNFSTNNFVCFVSGCTSQKQERRGKKACVFLGRDFLVDQNSGSRLVCRVHEGHVPTHKKIVCRNCVRGR